MAKANLTTNLALANPVSGLNIAARQFLLEAEPVDIQQHSATPAQLAAAAAHAAADAVYKINHRMPPKYNPPTPQAPCISVQLQEAVEPHQQRLMCCSNPHQAVCHAQRRGLPCNTCSAGECPSLQPWRAVAASTWTTGIHVACTRYTHMHLIVRACRHAVMSML